MTIKNQTKFILLLFAGLLISSCADPRSAPATAPDSAHSETITLWNNEPSNGDTVAAQFVVSAPLAAIHQPGVDQPARLTIAAYVRPDNDNAWYEAIVNDTFPEWESTFIRFLVAIEAQQGILDSVTAVRALCDSLPAECPTDTSGLIGAESDALGIQSLYQDSLAVAVADTTALGDRRDSLGLVLDDRYTLAMWFDNDTSTVYPLGRILADGRLAAQGIYLAETNSSTGLKGRGFQLDLASFEAADLDNPGRPIEINWTVCFGPDRPCLSEGTHTLRALVTGSESYITAAIILVYAEEQP